MAEGNYEVVGETQAYEREDVFWFVEHFKKEIKENPRLAGNVTLVFTLLFIEIDVKTNELIFMLKSKLLQLLNIIFGIFTFSYSKRQNAKRIKSIRSIVKQLG
mmetsp:Transcript_8692/g.9917  ORF Transcript_8692/g.9917 Transcript_8692/m.9917 type:complete len:103 (-) Transcript_8692:1121-1429(-)